MSSQTEVTLVYATNRREPRFDWFVSSLRRQLPRDPDVEVVFVDALCSDERHGLLETLIDGVFPWLHVPPKPCAYSGPHRRTRRDLFSAANARNTGAVYASKRYLVFVDDAAVLMPTWWREVQRAAHLRYVVAGAYQKHWRMRVRGGVLLSSRAHAAGLDVRWSLADDCPLVPIGGGHLFGSSFGLPRKVLRDVNGLDELCDGIGGEDYHLGLRLEWSDMPIYYSRDMLTIESEELHRRAPVPAVRVDRTLEAGDYMRRLARFGVNERHYPGPFNSSHMVLDVAYGTKNPRSIGNAFELRQLRPEHLPALAASLPDRFWLDDAQLETL